MTGTAEDNDVFFNDTVHIFSQASTILLKTPVYNHNAFGIFYK